MRKKLDARAKRLALAKAASIIQDERNKKVAKPRKKRRCGCRGR